MKTSITITSIICLLICCSHKSPSLKPESSNSQKCSFKTDPSLFLSHLSRANEHIRSIAIKHYFSNKRVLIQQNGIEVYVYRAYPPLIQEHDIEVYNYKDSFILAGYSTGMYRLCAFKLLSIRNDAVVQCSSIIGIRKSFFGNSDVLITSDKDTDIDQ